jgi:hypothetical protein
VERVAKGMLEEMLHSEHGPNQSLLALTTRNVMQSFVQLGNMQIALCATQPLLSTTLRRTAMSYQALQHLPHLQVAPNVQAGTRGTMAWKQALALGIQTAPTTSGTDLGRVIAWSLDLAAPLYCTTAVRPQDLLLVC